MVKIKIKIDKDILQKSAHCGMENDGSLMITNCAFALSVRDLFPDARVVPPVIYPTFQESQNRRGFPITEKMRSFITQFDTISPQKRKEMKEQEFELEIPDWALEHIDITDVKRIIEHSSHLELV